MVEVDLSKAEPSRNFRNSYLEKYDRIVNCVMKQREEFVALHEECEKVRKNRAAIIEDVVKILKELDVKPSKPLGNYDNEALIAELNRLIETNPTKNMEEVEIAIVRIRNRYRELEKVSKQVIDYAHRIDKYPDEGFDIVKEDDYEDEMVLNIPIKSASEKEKDQEQIIDKHMASDDLINELQKIIETNEEKEIIDTNSKESDDEYALCPISGSLSFKDFVNNIYNDKDDESLDSSFYWSGVYSYRDNKEKLDDIADEMGISIEELVEMPNVLDGIVIKFPTQFDSYSEELSQLKM